MFKIVSKLLFGAALLLTQIDSVFASEKLVSRSEKGLECKEHQASKPDTDEGDFIQFKCVSSFGPPMWMLIQEATRYSIGFGEVENTPQATAGDAKGAVEWWGLEKAGKFTPRTVIKRFKFSDYGEPEKRTQQLVVFRLLDNGKSCTLAVLDNSENENTVARKIARSENKCVE